MANQKIDFQELYKTGWDLFKKNYKFLILFFFVVSLLPIIVNILLSSLPAVMVSVINFLLTAYVTISMIKAAIACTKNETLTWNFLKNDLNVFIKFTIVEFLFSVMLFLGFVCLILPFFIVAALFFPVVLLVIIKPELSIIDTFKKSYEITSRNFVSCIIFMIISFVLMIIGIIPFFLGLLIVIPLFYITSILFCLKLLEETSSPVIETSASIN